MRGIENAVLCENVTDQPSDQRQRGSDHWLLGSRGGSRNGGTSGGSSGGRLASGERARRSSGSGRRRSGRGDGRSGDSGDESYSRGSDESGGRLGNDRSVVGRFDVGLREIHSETADDGLQLERSSVEHARENVVDSEIDLETQD